MKKDHTHILPYVVAHSMVREHGNTIRVQGTSMEGRTKVIGEPLFYHSKGQLN